MDFSIKACDWNKAFENGFAVSKADCIVVGVFESEPLAGPARALDTAGEGLLTRLMRSGDIDGKAGSTLVLHEVAGIDAGRVLVVGLGRRDKFDQKAFIEAARGAWRALSATRSAHAVWALAQERVDGRDAAWATRMSVVVARDLAYKFTRMKSAPEAAAPALRKMTLTVDAADEKAAKTAVKRGVAVANGMDLTRDLGNLPPNVCTPTYLADTAKNMARDFKLKVEVLGEKQLEAANMGSFLAVAKGSVEPPQFIILQYQGAGAKQAPVVLVGKGITFDSGGISLKAGEGMDEMKYDMLGAGSVLGAMRAIAEIAPKLNLICVVPTCENMPAGNASKPGDVVRTMSGKTVEILNTDAEGRLILCDALTYVERFKPAAVIDVATLTGACIIALGHHRSAMYASDDALADALTDASQQSADPVWRMPLDDEYKDQLKSNFADLANIGGRPAGSVTAACFLASFAQAYPWAHLDIAGTAWKSGAAKGATGRPVPLLTEYLLNLLA